MSQVARSFFAALPRDGHGPVWTDEVRRACTDAGLLRVSGPKDGSAQQAAVRLWRAAARDGLAAPLAETGIAGLLAAGAGLALPDDVVATVLAGAPGDLSLSRGQAGSWRLTGGAARVPWARDAEWVVACTSLDGGEWMVVLPAADVRTTPRENLAGEPRDDVTVDAVVSPERVASAAVAGEQVRRLGALARAAQLAGALEAVADLALAHGADRVQFGRPINRFQAVQAHLVRIASETVSGVMSVDLAQSCLPQVPLAEVAVAKIRTGRAATLVARHAHQVLGAIGTTELHPLGWWTPRLWSWRTEFGGERYWSERLGAQLTADGADALWPALAGLGGP